MESQSAKQFVIIPCNIPESLFFRPNRSGTVRLQQGFQIPDPGEKFPPFIGVPVENAGLGRFKDVVDGQDIRIVPYHGLDAGETLVRNLAQAPGIVDEGVGGDASVLVLVVLY